MLCRFWQKSAKRVFTGWEKVPQGKNNDVVKFFDSTLTLKFRLCKSVMKDFHLQGEIKVAKSREPVGSSLISFMTHSVYDAALPWKPAETCCLSHVKLLLIKKQILQMLLLQNKKFCNSILYNMYAILWIIYRKWNVFITRWVYSGYSSTKQVFLYNREEE